MVTNFDKFISVDWGTSRFRMRLVSIPEAKLLEEISSGSGVSTVNNLWENSGKELSRLSFFKHFLNEELTVWRNHNIDACPMVVSGMASSSIGMYEVPYSELPFSVLHDIPQFFQLEASEILPHPVYVLGGIRSTNNVMRGEETLLVGLTPYEMDYADHIVMPGTHSKHVCISDKAITGFATLMTGELFDLLCSHSILKVSLKASEFDPSSFLAGVEAASSGALLSNIFLVRTNQLFNQLTPDQNYHWLSGLLIAHELEAFRKINKVTLIAGLNLRLVYELALKQLNPGIQIQSLDDSSKLIEGQIAILNRIAGKQRIV
jgi:2-dehydro-3-deoxygalactonokinase